jgi:BirA family biotin operon repressor/biotin-[acetyl-CoA-carboxylase] ligase
LAIKTLVNTGLCLLAVPGDLARRALAGSRFADVRWVPETGSTNADALLLARDGEPEGIVLVADHQTAGRGRQGRTWEAPPEASLLVTVLLRPPAEVAGLVTMAVSVAANHVAGHPIDREPLLVAFLQHLDGAYGELVDTRRASELMARWRERSATLGRRVRVDLGADDVVGTAVDITAEGHLLVDTDEGDRRTIAVGDVVHLRNA